MPEAMLGTRVVLYSDTVISKRMIYLSLPNVYVLERRRGQRERENEYIR
jgi:hypothetical protein